MIMRTINTLILLVFFTSGLMAQVNTTLVFTNPDDNSQIKEFNIGDYVELHYLNKKKKHIKSIECRISEIKGNVLKVRGIENTFSGGRVPVNAIVGFQELDQQEAKRREEIKKTATTTAIASGFFAKNTRQALKFGAGIGAAEGIAKAVTKVEKGEEHWHWLVSVK